MFAVQHSGGLFSPEEMTMQISRHWRMNAQRYRLEGMRALTVETQQPQREPAQPQREQMVMTAPRARATAAR
jgi:hypothetical protein